MMVIEDPPAPRPPVAFGFAELKTLFSVTKLRQRFSQLSFGSGRWEPRRDGDPRLVPRRDEVDPSQIIPRATPKTLDRAVSFLDRSHLQERFRALSAGSSLWSSSSNFKTRSSSSSSNFKKSSFLLLAAAEDLIPGGTPTFPPQGILGFDDLYEVEDEVLARGGFGAIRLLRPRTATGVWPQGSPFFVLTQSRQATEMKFLQSRVKKEL